MKKAILTLSFLIICVKYFGQIDNSKIIFINKNYFSCYLNPFHHILEDVPDFERALEKFSDTLSCTQLKFIQRRRKVILKIEVDGRKLSEIQFFEGDEKGFYTTKRKTELDNYFACSNFIGEYRFKIENGTIDVFYSQPNGDENKFITFLNVEIRENNW